MNINELKIQLKNEQQNYYINGRFKRWYRTLLKHPDVKLYKIMKNAKLYHFYKKNRKGIINKLKFVYYSYKVNRNAMINNIELYGEFGNNLKICHGPVIVNGFSKLGDNVILHGMNCIGAKHLKDDAPIIGNNVEMGVGAVVIGKVTIADGIKIGANSVVTKSFLEPNITIAGIPAKKIK